MTDPRRKRSDGVRSLQDIRSRCVIDDETGCWMWRGAVSKRRNGRGQPQGRVWLPGVDGGVIETAARAAWLLSGRRIATGNVVWRSLCTDSTCINPEHGKSGTRPAMHAAMVADGRFRGDPIRAVVNAKNRESQLIPVETVRRAEAMFAAGVMQKTVRAELGICSHVAARIRKGLHPNCSSAQRVLPAASVFAWGERLPYTTERTAA